MQPSNFELKEIQYKGEKDAPYADREDGGRRALYNAGASEAEQIRSDLRHVRQALMAARKNMNEETFAGRRVIEALVLVNGCLFPQSSSHCHAASDGECSWDHCPQLRDDEPGATGRHCPLDTRDDDE